VLATCTIFFYRQGRQERQDRQGILMGDLTGLGVSLLARPNNPLAGMARMARMAALALKQTLQVATT
jgi:hypothetical protein